MFKPVSSKLNVNEMELAILKFWKDKEIFKRVTEERKGGKNLSFMKGRPLPMENQASIMDLPGPLKIYFPDTE